MILKEKLNLYVNFKTKQLKKKKLICFSEMKK